jgi:peptide/nickel transport system substrate-binding protein
MRHPIRLAAAVTLLAIASATMPGLIPAQAQTASDTGAPVVLRIGTIADMTTDNPFRVNSGSDWSVVTAQYDMLLKFSTTDLTPAPSISTGCVPSTDHMTWTCKIRSGLKWSDGVPLTSADVAFSYRFVIDHQIPQYVSYFPFKPTFETPDDTTLIWKSQQPTFAPDMPPWVYIVPEHIWSKLNNSSLKAITSAPNTPSIVSGPYMLTSWNHGQGWTMERNPYFWGTKPTVDKIEFRLYTNQEAMVQALKNGEIDFADGLQPSLFQTLQGAPNITTQKVVSDWWLNLAFNFGGQGGQSNPLPALHDLTVRKAIEMAINKQQIAEKVYLGTADAGQTVVRELSTYWHLTIPADQQIPFDPAGAAQLLQNAGYVDTNSDGIREDPKTHQALVLRMPASQDTTGAVDAGQLIIGDLKQIGIGVKLLPSSDAKMGDYWGSGAFDAYIWYWSGDPDPNYQLSVFTSGQCGGWSDGCWKDPNYDALYEQQRGIMDRAARLKVVQQAQQYIYDQIPVIVLADPSWLQAYRSDRFTGWIPAPSGNGYLIPGYNYDSLISVHPVSSAAAARSSSPGLPPFVWIIAFVGLAAIGLWLLRARRRVPLDEA